VVAVVRAAPPAPTSRALTDALASLQSLYADISALDAAIASNTAQLREGAAAVSAGGGGGGSGATPRGRDAAGAAPASARGAVVIGGDDGRYDIL